MKLSTRYAFKILVFFMSDGGHLGSAARRVEVKVCAPQEPVRLISARLTGQIKALQGLWPESPKRFIFNGVELVENMTFQFYEIGDGDSIIALPAEQGDSVFSTQQWLSLTRDSDNFNNSMRWMLDPRTSNEASRLRDLHLMKMERKRKVFMRMCAPFVNEGTAASSVGSTNTSYDAASEPSTEALPVFWAVD